jgi:predicted amidohydrolase
MGLVDKALWENRHADPAAIEAELRAPKGRSWLMRWLPARTHDNGLFLVYSNGVGLDDEIRTGNAMILDPYGRPAETDIQAFFGVTPPTVHQMIVMLEEKALIKRVPGQARTIAVLLPPEQLPPLE